MQAVDGLQAVLAGYALFHGGAKSRQQHIDIRRAVRHAKLHRLQVFLHRKRFLLRGVLAHCHVAHVLPSQRHAHQRAAVGLAPAYLGGGFLVGYQTQIRRRHRVAERRQARRKIEQARYHLLARRAQISFGVGHQGLSILAAGQVEVQSAARVALVQFRRKGCVQSVFHRHVADNPLAQYNVARRILDGRRQELHLVLFHVLAVQFRLLAAHLAYVA